MSWVLKIKHNCLNEVVEHKDRLCAQGMDFDKTYSTTGRLNLLFTLIAFSANIGLHFHQIDVNSAFLNSPLSETVFLSIPEELFQNQQKLCLRLNKAIHWLKQVPLSWYQCLKDLLIKKKFSPCNLDPCVSYCKGENPAWLYIHFDYIAIFGKNFDYFKHNIAKEFKVKEIGVAYLMLGIKIRKCETHFSLHQKHFTDSLFHLYNMDNCNPVSKPLIPNENLTSAINEEEVKFRALGIN
ncbi:hypothetical protein O181_011395 [Austropuccinia psidii MF-1]|uniref:Reverse transcriptase Ty1/copia-type domain-containing protein n=1 Tax=Austropuccinia psidii MF-1 TaxID=1389203 RepID=A0A9Q3BV24_9BASI|nr:hypothetical protein [Austropuccinia psidii MF-1]